MLCARNKVLPGSDVVPAFMTFSFLKVTLNK